jgi:hypothetical protein
LSDEDFKEAKKTLLKESVNEADDKKEEKKDDKKEEKKDDDAWKKEFSDFMKSDAKHLEKKATVFPEELQSLVDSFKAKTHNETDSGEIVSYAKDLLGIEESVLTEGKIKEIDMISREAESLEDFKSKLKEYVKSIGKAELADDKEFIDAMTADWKPGADEKK